MLLAGALVAAACGADDEATPAGDRNEAAGADDGTGGAADYDRDGVMRVQYFMPRMVWKVEETTDEGVEGEIWGNPQTHLAVLTQIMGTPLILGREGTYEPFLAESYDIVDPTTVHLTLREGVTFHDGSPYTAQILADFMLMIGGWENHAILNLTEVGAIESIDVASDTELTFNLSEPVAGLFPATLASVAAMVASPESNPPETVYGAGPFQIVDFEFEDHLTVEKYDDFYDADAYLLGGIEFRNIPDLTAAANALEGEQVDLIATTAAEVDALVQRGPFDSVITNNQGHYTTHVCNTTPPFDNPKFREAVDLAIDREQLVDVVLGGNGSALESLWPPGFPFAQEGLIDTDGDPERARELLDEIGWDESTEVLLGHFPGFQVHILIAETIIGQLAKVGINATLTEYPNYQYEEVLNPDTGGFGVLANVNAGVLAVQFHNNGEESTWNPCGFQEPDLQAKLDEIIAGDLSDAELEQAWAEVQEIVVEGHLWFPLMTQPSVYVYNSDRIGGVEPGIIGLTGTTGASLFFQGVYVKPS